jgi:hypothetical protein
LQRLERIKRKEEKTKKLDGSIGSPTTPAGSSSSSNADDGKPKKRGRKSKKELEEAKAKEAEMLRPLWQVICFTREDWEQITEKFADGKSKAERALYATLKEDFLPEIPRLFEEKEKLQR